MGAVAGIVGAGGNAGAVFAGFLLKTEGLSWHTAFFILGALITICSFLTFAVTFRPIVDSPTDAVLLPPLHGGTPEHVGAIA
jgi:NNP family nitrate/nitrite transporter-like MFS transporter